MKLSGVLANGTRIMVHAGGTVIVLPDGRAVEGAPQDDDGYRATAQRLGYGADTLAMCRDHDPLHAALTDWLGLPVSFSLRHAAGEVLNERERQLAALEEDAVLALQRFHRAIGDPT